MKNRLTARDWIDFGIRALEVDGFEALKGDILAKRLNVTRGSFYWHFVDLASFHQQLIDHWKTTSTEEIIIAIERLDASEERLKGLLNIAFGTSNDVDLQMRSWANHNELAAAAVAEIDRRRLDYIVALIEAEHIPRPTAETRAMLVYWSYLGGIQKGKRLEGPQLESVVEELFAFAIRAA